MIWFKHKPILIKYSNRRNGQNISGADKKLGELGDVTFKSSFDFMQFVLALTAPLTECYSAILLYHLMGKSGQDSLHNIF